MRQITIIPFKTVSWKEICLPLFLGKVKLGCAKQYIN